MKNATLSLKNRPRQPRSHDTFEAIIAEAGQILDEVGFQNLTTNLICKNAGLTPPALYRYFPNKYAILKELGERLTKIHVTTVSSWIDSGGLAPAPFETRVYRATVGLRAVIDVTKKFPGSAAIIRALRATPILKDIRTNSLNSNAQHHAIALARLYPSIPADTLLNASRVCIEMMYAAMEASLESNEKDSEIFIQGLSRAVVLYLEDIQNQHQR